MCHDSVVDGQRRAKLVCTIGPASADEVDGLVAAGMDVARLNFSHGTVDGHGEVARRIRASHPEVAILVDLPGPKIRLGELADHQVTLGSGSSFTLRPSDSALGDATGAHVSYGSLAEDARPGDRILLADGAVELRVTAADGGEVATEVIRGGTIRSRAGVSVPSDRISQPALTDADRAGAPRAAQLGADYVAQSFVRRATDVDELRSLLGPDGPAIVAKIETRPAVDDFDAICRSADAVMIARGDLGVELPFEEIPLLQKDLLRRALDLGVPTIVATQMLESMIVAPRPTRAEASDVANAVLDGAGAVMLSAETAIGAHPLLAAEAAVRIVLACEERGGDRLPAGAPSRAETDAEAVAFAAVALAGADREVAAIACYTRTGRTARVLSALRPRVPVMAYAPESGVIRRLALIHGIESRDCVAPTGDGGRLELVAARLDEEAVMPAGTVVVLVASSAAAGSGPNLLAVHRIGDRAPAGPVS